MKKIIAIFICGCLGSAGRYLLTSIGTTHHLWVILAINVLGSFILPLITGALPLLLPVAPHVVTGLSVGLVGSLTTFSTFAGDTLNLLHQNAYGLALLYVSASLALGGGAAYAGIRTSQRLIQRWRDL